MGGFKDLALDGLNTIMMLLIVFGMIFVLAGTVSGFNVSDPTFGLGISLIVIAGMIMFFSAFIRNKM